MHKRWPIKKQHFKILRLHEHKLEENGKHAKVMLPECTEADNYYRGIGREVTLAQIPKDSISVNIAMTH